jgi:hypothetical protein
MNERRPVTQARNRPDIRDLIPKGVLFSTEGPTGWGRKRDLGNYKEGKSEHDFSHLNAKWVDPEDAA